MIHSKTITNKHEATISAGAINSVLNIKTMIRELKTYDALDLDPWEQQAYDERCRRLHHAINGWS